MCAEHYVKKINSITSLGLAKSTACLFLPVARTSGLPPTNPSKTDTSGKKTRSSSEHSVEPITVPGVPDVVAVAVAAFSNNAIISNKPCPSVSDERGGGGRSRRVRHIRRRAAVSWNRTQRSPAEELTRIIPVPGQGKRTLARGRKRSRHRALALLCSRASFADVWAPECWRKGDHPQVHREGGMQAVGVAPYLHVFALWHLHGTHGTVLDSIAGHRRSAICPTRIGVEAQVHTKLLTVSNRYTFLRAPKE